MVSGLTTEILPDRNSFARRVADWILGIALATSGRFAVALSGGSTPPAIYKLLAAPPYRDRFPWPHAHWFWGDERFVPHASARSNYGMARETFLSRAPVPPGNIHPIRTEGLTAEAAAAEYERELKMFYGRAAFDPSQPLFEINLLGLGENGHFASLFPGADTLSERQRWVVATDDPQSEPRITLTYPALESSRHPAFLVAGEAKASILQQWLAGDPTLPASRFHPIGQLYLFTDEAAAAEARSKGQISAGTKRV